MTGIADPQKAFEAFTKAVFEGTAAYGYRRSGSMIKKIAHGNAAIIEFQKSRGSTKNHVKFTINLAIVCGEMLKIDGLKYPFGTTLQSAKAVDGHLSLRVGHIIGINDIWWEIGCNSKIQSLINEVHDVIFRKCIPYLEIHISSKSLLELWVTNGLHGLMPKVRDSYIEALSEILESQPDLDETDVS